MTLTRSVRRLLWACATASAGLATVAPGQIWDGGGTDNAWTTANNWIPNGVPVNDGAANILFRGSVRLTPVLTLDRSVLSIGFDSPAGAFVIDNDIFRTDLTIGSGGIINRDNSLQTIACPVVLGAAQTWEARSGDLSISVVTGNGFPLTINGIFNTRIGRIVGGSSSLIKNGAGTLTIDVGSSQTGGTSVNAGTLLVTNPTGSATGTGTVTVAAGATLRGMGIIGGPVQNNGAVQPGASPGILTLQNTYTQGAGGSLGIEIGGPGAGTQYDRLSVSGTATLAGALTVTLINGYVPLRGDTFDILTAGAISGEFASLTLPPLPVTRIWQITYLPTAVRLSVSDSAVLTYQGRLKNGTQLANGPHDFQFRLFDAASGGSQVAGTQCADNVPVSGGLFAASIDFGGQYANPAPRFLEIQVRADTGLDCSSTAGFTPLPARQAVLTHPTAAHATSAFALDAPNGSHPSAVFVDDDGQIGIGTTSPHAPIHVMTTGEGLRMQGAAAGTLNTAWISFRDGAGTETGYVGDASSGDGSMYLTSDAGDLQVRAAGNMSLTANVGGNICIGNTLSGVKLAVMGEVALGPSGQFRAAAGQQNLRVIRGVIDRSTGAILAGSGFSVAHPGTGMFNITFTTPFSDTPSVTATAQGLGSDFFNEAFAMTQSVTASGANLQVLARSDGNFIPRNVHFIAIGPR